MTYQQTICGVVIPSETGDPPHPICLLPPGHPGLHHPSPATVTLTLDNTGGVFTPTRHAVITDKATGRVIYDGPITPWPWA